MNKDFVYFYVYIEYSLFDGFLRVKKFIKRVKELNMSLIVIIDYGCMFGVIDFYKIVIKEGIKLIIGCEVYIVVCGLRDKDLNYDKY